MGQARAHRPIALVVEDDASQRVLVTTLLEESEMSVIQCESAEAAEVVMNKIGSAVSLLFTDVKLAGNMTGLELADKAKARYPEMTVIITSGVRQLLDLVNASAMIQPAASALPDEENAEAA